MAGRHPVSHRVSRGGPIVGPPCNILDKVEAIKKSRLAISCSDMGIVSMSYISEGTITLLNIVRQMLQSTLPAWKPLFLIK